ncbi:NlpC/P60 family protein [Candidatus Clostridium stratigraminis]|uniref:NlpC/P60 family protein n=1 Tax=Candidatus Clostridium stratigraminis TaxID=3381661 RepID=A0ABW8T9A7_9CLOT
MKKKVLSALMAVGIIISIGVPVFADPSEDQLNNQLQNQQNQLQKNSNSLQEIQGKRQEIEHSIEKLDFQIEGLMRDINDTKSKIQQTQDQIKLAEADILKAEEDMKAEKDIFNKRMRAMYINGADGYLNILLEASSFNDFLSRIEAVEKIIQADSKIMSNLKIKKDDVSQKKKILDDKNNKLNALKSNNEQKLSKLNESKNQQASLISDLKNQERLYGADIDNSKKAIEAIKKQIDDLRISRGTTSGYNDIISYIFSNNADGKPRFIGTPYVWGGSAPYNYSTGTGGFDCSGFVQYVYRQFGVYLPRTTYDQINSGIEVSRNDLKPGDLVLFGTWSNPHHIGIYYGKIDGVDQFIHAPQTGDVIKVSPLIRADYLTARRVK